MPTNPSKVFFDSSINALPDLSTASPARIAPYKLIPCRHVEIVLGTEHRLIEEITAHLSEGNVLLDLGLVARIDAAGISALIRLYHAAQNAGRRFAVSSPSRHVKETLELVGVETFLSSRIVNTPSQSGPICGISAA